MEPEKRGRGGGGGRRRGMLALVIALVVGMIAFDPGVQVAFATTPAFGTECNSTAISATVSCTISALASDVMIVFVTTSSGTPGTPSISGGGITFNSRNTGSTTGATAAEFWGGVSTTITSQTVSDTVSGGTTPNIAMVVFTVTGADTSAPFDPSLGTPPVAASGTTGTPTVSFATTGTDDFLIGLVGMAATVTQTAGASCTTSCTLIATASTAAQSGAAEYATTTASATQTLDFGATVTAAWVMLGDALVTTGGTIPDLPFGVLPLLLLVPVAYLLMKARVQVPSSPA
jgi:hypothetical protein